MSGLAGRSILVTGGTKGIGRATILELARHHPEIIYFTGRSAEAGSQLEQEVRAIDKSINALFIQSDHADLDSVRAATKQIISKLNRVDILVLNAGIMGQDASLTKQGYELQFGVNHLAHAFMLKLFRPLLIKTSTRFGDARVVVIGSSFPWRPKSGIEFSTLKTSQNWWYGGRWMRYGQSKLANAAYAKAFAERNPSVSCICVHPGLISSTGLWSHKLNLFNRLFVKASSLALSEPIEKAMTIIYWAATTPKEELMPGAYYEKPGIPVSHSKAAANADFRRTLWDWTEKELHSWD